MSLDVYLEVDEFAPRNSSGIFVRRAGATVEITREEWDALNPGREPCVVSPDSPECVEMSNCVCSLNITHNLGKMARSAGVYEALWRPEEVGIAKAEQLIAPLEDGLARLKADPEHFKQHNPENGWGNYEGLVGFIEEYLAKARQHPEARVSVSR